MSRTNLVNTEYQPLERGQPPLREGEQTGFQAVITSPWVMRWAAVPSTYATYREIRKHPTIALARELTCAPILAGEWSVEADRGVDSKWIDLIEKTFMPLRDDYLANACYYGNVDFGYAPFEKIYERKDGYLTITRLKPLYHDITEICIGHKGSFIGFRQLGVDIGLANALHVGFRVEGSMLYGIPLLENTRKAYDWWMECNAGARRYDKKIAGCHIVVEYPLGSSRNSLGIMEPNATIAARVLQTLESAGGVAIPRDIAAFMAQLNTDNPGWKIWIMDQGGAQQQNFVDGLAYLDKLLCRSLLMPERSALEGSHGTLAEAEAHQDIGFTVPDVEHGRIVTALNRQAVDQMLVVNFGEEARGKVRLVASPIGNTKKALLRDVYQAVLGGQCGPEEIAKLDMSAIRDQLGIPAVPGIDADDKGSGVQGGGGDSDIMQAYVDPTTGRISHEQNSGRNAPQGLQDSLARGSNPNSRLRLAGKPSAGRWITIGGDRHEGGGAHVFIGSDGTIQKGPASLKGKNVRHLQDHLPAAEQKALPLKAQRKARSNPQSQENTNPNAPPRHVSAVNPKTVAGAAIHEAAKEHGVDPDELAEVAREMHSQKLEPILYREAAKAHAREATGLTMRDISRMENKGHDFNSARVGGVTGAKVKKFDTIARELAHQYPDILGSVSDGEDTIDHVSPLWDLIREGKAVLPKLHDSDNLRDAADYLHNHSRNDEPTHDYGEFSNGQRTGIALYLAGQMGLFDETKHPRDKGGEFARGGSGKQGGGPTAKPAKGQRSFIDGVKPASGPSGVDVAKAKAIPANERQTKMIGGMDALPGQRDLTEEGERPTDPVEWQATPSNPMSSGSGDWKSQFGPDGELIEGQIGRYPITTQERGLIEKVSKRTQAAIEEALSNPVIDEAMRLAGIKNICIEKKAGDGKPKNWSAGMVNGTLLIHSKTAEVIAASKEYGKADAGVGRLMMHEIGHALKRFVPGNKLRDFAKALDDNPGVVDKVSKMVNVKPPRDAFDYDERSRLISECFAEVHAIKYYDPKAFAAFPEPIRDAVSNIKTWRSVHGE